MPGGLPDERPVPAAATLRLLDVAGAMLENLDLEVVLERVLEAARELTRAQYAAIGVLDPSRRQLVRFITAGLEDGARQRIGAPPRGHGVLGELIIDPCPLRLADVGEHPRSYGFPPAHPPMRTLLGVPVQVAGRPFGNLYLAEKAGAEEFSEADEEAVVRLADLAGIAIDHAQRYQAVESQRSELRRTVEALDATVQITRAVGGETDLKSILGLVAKRGRALVSARTLVIAHERNGEMLIAAGAGELPDGLLGRAVGPANGAAGPPLRTARTVRLDAGAEPDGGGGPGLGDLGLQAQAGLLVPLIFRGRTYGALIAVDRLSGGPSFTPHDQRLLEAFATSAASALATAQSVASDRRAERLLAAEQERSRWARELHDETLQSLAALRIGLIAQLHEPSLASMVDAVREAIAELDREIGNLRSLVTELRPAALDDLGTQAALEDLAERARARGLEVDLGIDLHYEQGRAADRHPPEVEAAMYRIVQEALNNALKHGGARRAVVEIQERDTAVDLSIRDDGEGFDTAARTTGFGLVGMRERAELLDGRLEIVSAPGDGTTITVNLPTQRGRQPKVA